MIASLRLQNFRSYDDASFEFADGVNIIVGPNGSGKTNLLEALLLLARGGSYRTSGAHLIKHGADWARLDGMTDKGTGRILKLRTGEEKVNKEFVIDDVLKKRLSPQTILQAVVFEPNHLQLISGDPGLRRDFLDELSVHITPEALLTQRNYRRALAQRNSLLKQGSPKKQFFVWDVRLAEIAETIAANRRQSVDIINKSLLDTYQQLGGRAKSLNARYESRFNPEGYGEQLMNYLNSHWEIDLKRGFTGAGPHREDVVFEFDGIDARNKASRGEARTILLALKIIEMELAEKLARPLLLLDDVFSELDGKRRRALAERLGGYQTFITTTDADIAVEHFADKATIIPVGTT